MQLTCLKLRNHYQTFFVDMNNIPFKPKSFYVVETEHGIDIGQTFGCQKTTEEKNIEKKGKILREAGEEDLKVISEIESIEANAFNVCKEKIQKRQLEMKLVSVKSIFDKTKIIFYFVAENRIDFRDLVKDLAAVFRTRIEMRQIGVRDETRICGGHGLCGRELCCVYLKEDFDPVSIKMAKEQNLNLNSLKISGMCGRLLCCLGYEYDVYKELNDSMPKPDTKIEVGDKRFTVHSIEPLRGTLKLVDGDKVIEVHKTDLIKEGDKYKVSSKALHAITTAIKKEDADDEDDLPGYKL